jgi:hypothetical protein
VSEPVLTADWNDPEAIEAIASAIRDWEPRIDLTVPPTDARLFEPDGVLYAVSLADWSNASFGHRECSVGLGDLLIVPQGVPLDIEPSVMLVGVRYEGPAPDHFRERFIQVWGFEHRPATLAPAHDGLVDVIAPTEVAHRVPYAVWSGNGRGSHEGQSGLDLLLLIGLAGSPDVALGESAAPVALRHGRLALLMPGCRYALRGAGSVGRLTLASELMHEHRRFESHTRSNEPISPEYKP